MPKLDRSDVQGLVFFGYGSLPFGACLWLAVEEREAAAAWLGELAPRITSAEERPRGVREARAQNIAFTAAGLAALGVNAATMQTFAAEFQDGMAEPNRARFNGDTGDSAPERWELGGPGTPPLHAVLLLFARDAADRDAFANEVARGIEERGGVRLLHRIDSEVAEDKREHFGFRDGMSQPRVAGVHADADDDVQGVTQMGDFLLGYPDGYKNTLRVPHRREAEDPVPRSLYVTKGVKQQDDLGFNGSYMVFRKLHQDVAGFNRMLNEQSRDASGEPDSELRGLLGAKMLGRWPSGASLVEAPEKDTKQYTPEQSPMNKFLYLPTDPRGDRCPIGAHVRRANPRDALAPSAEISLKTVSHHRLLRRGRPYGPRLPSPEQGVDDGEDRGLLFICFNTSLRRQFEMTQQLWINSYNFNDLFEEADVISGDSDGGRGFSMPGAPYATRVEGIARFVQVRGGAYCFLPGRRGLASLIELARGG